jgi:hypothetical protein
VAFDFIMIVILPVPRTQIPRQDGRASGRETITGVLCGEISTTPETIFRRLSSEAIPTSSAMIHRRHYTLPAIGVV